jgi:hypothetical protein
VSDNEQVGPAETHGKDAPERMLYNMSQANMADVLLTIYFLGAAVASGVIGLVAQGELGTLLGETFGTYVGVAFSAAMILVGVAGVGARLANTRMGEMYAVIALAGLTLINGALLLPEHPQTALRLLFAPCMMVPYGWMRTGFVIPRSQVSSLNRAIQERNDEP